MAPERRRKNGVGREERRHSVHRRQLLEMTVGARFQGAPPPKKNPDAPSSLPFFPLPSLLSFPLPPLPLEVGPIKSS